MPENKVWYLGVDPGSAKTGFAWVEADGRIKKVAVLATETLPEVLPQILGSAPAAVILGNGTNCDSIKKMLMEVTNVIKILRGQKIVLAGKPSAGLAPFTSFGSASSAC